MELAGQGCVGGGLLVLDRLVCRIVCVCVCVCVCVGGGLLVRDRLVCHLSQHGAPSRASAAGPSTSTSTALVASGCRARPGPAGQKG